MRGTRLLLAILLAALPLDAGVVGKGAIRHGLIGAGKVGGGGVGGIPDNGIVAELYEPDDIVISHDGNDPLGRTGTDAPKDLGSWASNDLTSKAGTPWFYDTDPSGGPASDSGYWAGNDFTSAGEAWYNTGGTAETLASGVTVLAVIMVDPCQDVSPSERSIYGAATSFSSVTGVFIECYNDGSDTYFRGSNSSFDVGPATRGQWYIFMYSEDTSANSHDVALFDLSGSLVSSLQSQASNIATLGAAGSALRMGQFNSGSGYQAPKQWRISQIRVWESKAPFSAFAPTAQYFIETYGY